MLPPEVLGENLSLPFPGSGVVAFPGWWPHTPTPFFLSASFLPPPSLYCLEACRMFCLSLVVWNFTMICSGWLIFIYVTLWLFKKYEDLLPSVLEKCTEIVSLMLSPLQPSHRALPVLSF